MKLDRFFVPVEDLTDAELVAQFRTLQKLRNRRRRREALRVEATARRLLDSLDEPETDSLGST